MIDLITVLIALGELIGILLFILAIGLTFVVWKNNRNPIDLWTLFLFICTAFLLIYSGVLKSLKSFELIHQDYLIMIGLLDLYDIVGLMIGVLYLWFIIYVIGLKKFYSLPFVLFFYAAAYGMITGNQEFNKWLVVFTLIPSTVILIVNAFRNKHGLSFAIALMGLSGVIFSVFSLPVILNILLKWLTAVNVILGENGWWDDHVFFDRAKRKKIQNVWIAKMITTDN